VVGTLAVFPVEPAHTEEAAGVIVWAGAVQLTWSRPLPVKALLILAAPEPLAPQVPVACEVEPK
jgi:hypothetical protein